MTFAESVVYELVYLDSFSFLRLTPHLQGDVFLTH